MEQAQVPRQAGRREWVVTTPHEQPRPFGLERAPWGLRHVRRDGASVTACGLPTASWRTFWTLEFVTFDRESCPACAQAFARVRSYQ